MESEGDGISVAASLGPVGASVLQAEGPTTLRGLLPRQSPQHMHNQGNHWLLTLMLWE